MSDVERMQESTERCRNMRVTPLVYGFRGESLRALYDSLTKAFHNKDPRLLVRLGRKIDGTAEAWLDVKVGDVRVGTYNYSYTCPPQPPEECDE